MGRRPYVYCGRKEGTEMDWPPPGYDPNYGSGYKVTLDQFLQLIGYPPYRNAIAPLLREWFGYELVGERDATIIRSATGEKMDATALHERIQTDPKMQYRLYQTAMSLWR